MNKGCFKKPKRALAKTIERVATARLPTEYGAFRIIGYRSLTSDEEFIALVRGEPQTARSTLVRIHSQCLTGDAFSSTKCDCGRQLQAALRLIAEEECGVIVYQQQEGRGIGLINEIRAYALQDAGATEAHKCLGLEVDLRQYEQCAEILLDVGLSQVRVLSSNPEKIRAIKASGLEVVARLALEPPPDATPNYLGARKERVGTGWN